MCERSQDGSDGAERATSRPARSHVCEEGKEGRRGLDHQQARHGKGLGWPRIGLEKRKKRVF